MIAEVLAGVLVLAGVALFLLAGVGLLRFPDVYTRSHAATKPATLGLLLVMLGAALALEDGSDRTKVLLVAAFQFVTAPVAAHMIGRSAYRARVGRLDELVVDSLAERAEQTPGGQDAPGGQGEQGEQSATPPERS